MTEERIAYTWEINGRTTINPDVFLRHCEANGIDIEPPTPLIMIDCPRGAHAGRAHLLFSKEDAEAIVALTDPQTITVKKWTQTVAMNGAMTWNTDETYQFQGYYILGIKDAFGVNKENVYVELADARYLLDVTMVRKRYNVVRKKPPGEEYDPDTLIVTDTPFTYQQILDDLIGGLFPATLPVSYPTPRNLVFSCSLAEALDQLLASLGCVLAYNPLTDIYSIVQLTDAIDLSIVSAAKNEGRLLNDTNLTASTSTLPGKVTIRPADIVALTTKAKELPAKPNASIMGSGTRTILIDDHEFTPDLDRIAAVIDAWYGEQNFLLDNTFQGIVKQGPANHISNVSWYFDSGATRTHIENRMPVDIPWPKQPILASANSSEDEDKPAFVVQGFLATRTGTDPESKFPAWGGDEDIAYVDSGSLVVLSPVPYKTLTPFSECKNPHGLNGEEGDTFVAVRKPKVDEDDTEEAEQWILINVYSKKSTIFFTFDISEEDTDPHCSKNFDQNNSGGVTGYDAEYTVTVTSWRHPGRGTEGFTGEDALKVQDTFLEGMLAQNGDVGYAEWNTDKQCWSIIRAQHYARRIRGEIYADGTGTPPDHFWLCHPKFGYDGYINSEDEHHVYVPAEWDVVEGAVVWYEWNPENCRYEAYQRGCDS